MYEPYTPPDLTGRIAAVTGANKGIGLWTAIGLAKAGARVAMICRNARRGEEAQAFVTQRSGSRKLDLFLADFADLKAVGALGHRLSEAYPRLDILVNNAGLFAPKRELTPDGYEMTFAVNHLAPFLLTNKVLPSLERAGQATFKRARIVNVSSAASRRARIDFNDLMFSRGYGMLAAYGQSKLANILFTNELARRLEGHPITANCLHPGVVGTEIGNTGWAAGFVWNLMKPVLMSPERGAVNSLYVATSPEIGKVSGVFFVKQRPEVPNPVAQDPQAAARLWAESERLVNAALNRVKAPSP